MEEKILDIAHVAFLDTIRALVQHTGPINAKGTLVRVAVKAGEKLAPVNFADFEEFVTAINRAATPIARIEGKAVYRGNGLFGLPVCPFAQSVRDFQEVFGGLPESFAGVAEEFNKPGPVTETLRVGHGAGVGAFCSIHQPMRASAAKQVTIGGKPIVVFQLGCKAPSGKKAFADRFIAEGGWSREDVDGILTDHMCCYGIKVEP